MKWLSTTLALLGLFLWTAQALEVQIVCATLVSRLPLPSLRATPGPDRREPTKMRRYEQLDASSMAPATGSGDSEANAT